MLPRISLRPLGQFTNARAEDDSVIRVQSITKLNASNYKPLPVAEPCWSLAAHAVLQLARHITNCEIDSSDLHRIHVAYDSHLLRWLLPGADSDGQTDDPRVWVVLALIYALPEGLATRRTPLSDPFIQTLNSLHLVVLDFTKHPHALDDENVLSLRLLHRLVVLDLRGNTKITSYGVRKLAWSTSFGTQTLRALGLHGCVNIDAQAARDAVAAWKALEVIGECSYLPDFFECAETRTTDVRYTACHTELRLPGYMKPEFKSADALFYPKSAIRIARELVGRQEPLVHVDALDFASPPRSVLAPRRRLSIPVTNIRPETAATELDATLLHDTRPRQRFDVQFPTPQAERRDAVELVTFDNNGMRTSITPAIAPIIHNVRREQELLDIQERRRQLDAASGVATSGVTPTSVAANQSTELAPLEIETSNKRAVRASLLPADPEAAPSSIWSRTGRSKDPTRRPSPPSYSRPIKRQRHSSSPPSAADESARFPERLALLTDTESELMFVRDPAYAAKAASETSLQKLKPRSSTQSTAPTVAAIRARKAESSNAVAKIMRTVAKSQATASTTPVVPHQPPAPPPQATPVRKVPFGKATLGRPPLKPHRTPTNPAAR
ncbi:hypothetical protein BKA62DRAFT_217275 [Auriculariales sp. MPI-PUGE-AT-0066]|nr:hypothetical protein BKA62DRAFT_217275 [Auriculariales sp. MPI-PUGE-AT-0066]